MTALLILSGLIALGAVFVAVRRGLRSDPQTLLGAGGKTAQPPAPK